MKPRALIIVWLVLVGLFAGYGFSWPGQHNQIYGQPFDYGKAFEVAMIYGGIGFTLATCLVVILYAIQRLRAKSVTGMGAILFVLLSSAIAAIIPPALMAFSGRYHGESTLVIAYVGAYTIGISLELVSQVLEV